MLAQARVATRQAKLALDSGDWAAARASAQAAISAIDTDPGALGRAPDLLIDALLLDTRALFFAGVFVGIFAGWFVAWRGAARYRRSARDAKIELIRKVHQHDREKRELQQNLPAVRPDSVS